MPTTIRIPTPLRKLTGDRETIEADGATVGELLTTLETSFPGLRERIRDETGSVRRFVNIYVNDEDIRFLQDQATAVQAGDEVRIVPAIAGG